MPDRPDDPVVKSGPNWVKTHKSSPQESTVTLFASNTATIVASSFAHPSASTEVQLRSLEDGAPKNVPLSTFYRWLLVGLIVFAVLCVVAIVILAFFVSPEQTAAQKDAVALLKYLAVTIIGMAVGLFTGKQL
jgi:hypothetical protein